MSKSQVDVMGGCGPRSLGYGLAMALGVLAAAPASAAVRPPPPRLNAIILLATPAQVMPDGWPGDPHRVDATRLPDLAGAGTEKALGGLLGQPITAALLMTVRKTIEQQLTAIHRPFAAISIPHQQVHDGVLQVVVTEARLGTVTVDGAKWFSSQQYRDAVRIAPGEPIDSRKLSAATDAINANPYRHGAIVASPGASIGTTDLTVHAKDRFPVSVNFGFDNTGNNTTGLYRLTTGVDWGNAFWRGDDLNYQFSASPDFYRFRQNSLSYTTTLPWGDTLSVMTAYATSDGIAQGPVGSRGKNINASLRYNAALPSLGSTSAHMIFGYDFKSTNNNVLFGGTDVFPTTSQIDQFVVGIDARRPDSLGATEITLTAVGSPGGLTGLNTDAAFAAQQPGARAEYAYARLTVERLTNLPAHLAWYSVLTGQLSTGILLPSEQLSFGGVQSIRGFVEQGTTRDEGVVLQNELRGPGIATGMGRLLHLGAQNDVLTPFVFLDAGAGGNHADVPGEPASWVELISIGPGVTWQLAPYASARFTWGFPLLREGSVGPLLGPQFGLQVAF